MVADPLRRHRWRRGGTAEAQRWMWFCILILFLIAVVSYNKVMDMKDNYTSLHDDVNKLKYLHEGGHNVR